MQKHIILICCILIAINVTIRCDKKSDLNHIEKFKWQVIENNNHKTIAKGEIIEFNKKAHTCNWGKIHDLNYYTNDSLLLLNNNERQQVFRITYHASFLKLEELYTSNNNTLKLEPIYN